MEIWCHLIGITIERRKRCIAVLALPRDVSVYVSAILVKDADEATVWQLTHSADKMMVDEYDGKYSSSLLGLK
ncbi:hypothetical protein ACTXT7_016435 [Hymenolepis weldensis]